MKKIDVRIDVELVNKKEYTSAKYIENNEG